MKKTAKISLWLKLTAASAAVAIGLFGFIGLAGNYNRTRASVSGPSPSFTNAPGEANCTVCHTDFPVDSGTGDIVINGIPANYLPGSQIPVSVTVSQSDAVIYGFQLTAVDGAGRRAGTLSIAPVNPQPLQVVSGIVGGNERQYVEHTKNGVTPSQFGSHTWNFTWTAPMRRVGRIGFYAAGNAANSDNIPGGDYIYTGSEDSLSGTALASFDGDSKSDIGVYRPSTGFWYSINSSDGSQKTTNWGAAGDTIVPGDYDGDGTADIAVWRSSTGSWYILRSSDGGIATVVWGVGSDRSVQADYDGDGRTDIAVWRPSTGEWHISRSSDGQYESRIWGVSTDVPVQADFDADAKTDVSVWRPQNGTWYILPSGGGGYSATVWGAAGDTPVQADYDGDGRVDIGVFRAADGFWHLLRSTEGYTAHLWGGPADEPVPTDYDGDGRADIAVFRPFGGFWYIVNSSDGSYRSEVWGAAGDLPVITGYGAQ